MHRPDAQLVLVDTPGIHRAKEGGINEFMVNEARDSVAWSLFFIFLLYFTAPTLAVPSEP